MSIKDLCDVLTATRQYIHQTHLLARNKGYALHTLTNDVYERIGEHIDRLKELSISIYQDNSLALAESSLSGALDVCRQIPDLNNTSPQTMVKTCIALLLELGELIEDLTEELSKDRRPFRQGMINALGDISEKLAHDKYFLDMEVLREENSR